MAFRPISLLLLASPALATQSTLSEATPAPARGTLMPTPPAIDVALDDAVPLEGERPLGDPTQSSTEFEKGLESPLYLGFVSGRHYPPADERIDPRLVAQVRTLPTDGRPEPTAYAYVMFGRRITPARLELLRSLGCRVLGFHPGYCIKVALRPELIDEVGALEFVRWIGVPRAPQKLSLGLSEALGQLDATRPLDLIVNVFESDLCEATTAETTARAEQFDPGVGTAPLADAASVASRLQSNGWQQRALEAAGLEVLSYTQKDSVRAFHVRAPLAALERLVELDFVEFVEEEPLAAPLHDESMPFVSADVLRSITTGGTSQSVVCGEIDTGLWVGHTDLASHLHAIGWDFSGSMTGPWDDPCGHGTHVTGTITGSGATTPSLRGVAPGLGWGPTGRFQQVKAFLGCGLQPVNLSGIMGVLRTGVTDNTGAFTPRAHVINNSWGSSATNATGTEFSARLIDDEVYWQQQMYVFAAGNDANPGRIGFEAAAKNSFTVGSVNSGASFNNLAPDRSGFSSQGPTGDQRWKPNVVAPGNEIRSLMAGTTSGYTLKSGTSMATPHVTGIVAQMLDTYPWMRYRPTAAAALLMASAATRSSAPIFNHNDPSLNAYGAGCVDAWLSTFNTQQSTFNSWNFDLGAGQGTYADFYVPAGTTRIVVCTTWNEVAASSGAPYAAVNDWDLYIDQEPFTAGLDTGEFNAGKSSRNTTELRYIENPATGWFRWKLNPYSALSNARFSVAVHFVQGDVHPTVQLTLTPSTYFAKVDESVPITASVFNPGYLASAVLIEGIGSPALTASSATLLDGSIANFLGSRAFMLGNLLAANTRVASFSPRWWFDGVWTFTCNVTPDNGPPVSADVQVTVDSTPPTAVSGLVSTSHPVAQWACGSNVAMAWQSADDALSGVSGYSVQWDYAYDTDPDDTVDTPFPFWFELLTPDAGYFFHVRAIDRCGNAGPTEHLGPFYFSDPPIAAFCAPKMNSQSCLPYMTWTGQANVNGPDDFHLQATNILNQKSGLMFWSSTYATVPFQGGMKCVGNPLRRTGAMNSGGSLTGNDCSGTFDFHWSHAFAAANGVSAGDWLYCQFWYRDPGDPFATGLTDAVTFLVCEQ
jgi:subtilisin family serine protease